MHEECRVEWSADARKVDLLRLVRHLVPYLMAHNSEADAVDLLATVDRLADLLEHVDQAAYQRVALYLTSCVPYVPDPENLFLLEVCLAA